jgi:uncharacterized repeat protein (TIGR03803 family)
VLYRFQGGNDGSNPYAGVVANKRGELFGTTEYSGGSSVCQGGCGAVFKLTPMGSGYTERVLYRFFGGNDGGNPSAALLEHNGALYGTTTLGGNVGGSGCGRYGCGIVFELRPSRNGYEERVIHAFQGGSDGAGPLSNLIADKGGALYGTTSGGGQSACFGGCGTVFKLTPAGSGFTESVLYRFVPESNLSDGFYPQAGLVMDGSGALYGTSLSGGGQSCHGGCGTVFKLAPTASHEYCESVRLSFHGTSDGAFPYAGLVAYKTGALYGATSLGGGGGGTTCGRQGWYGCGVVFALIP